MRPWTNANLILVRPDETVAATVELRAHPTPEQYERAAAQVREFAAEDRADYAVLLTADRLGIWSMRDAWSAEGDAGPILRGFYERVGVGPEDILGFPFGMLAEHAFDVLVDSVPGPRGERYGDPSARLREFAPDFAEAIRGTLVRAWDSEDVGAAA